MLHDLISEIDAHLSWRRECGRDLAETTFGRHAVDDGKLVGRLRAGGQVTMSKAAQIRAWIKADRRAARRLPRPHQDEAA